MNLNLIQVAILQMLDANGVMLDFDLYDKVREHLQHHQTHITVATMHHECELLTNMNQIITVQYRREDIVSLRATRFVYFPGDCNIRVENYR